MRDTFIRTLTELAANDPRIMLITGDLGFGVVTSFAQRFPRQFLNAGVAEPNMTGLAAGIALEGRTVFTYSIANFPTLRCLEQIRNDVCYHDANVKIVAIGGGFSYGQLGISHHATEDLAILRTLPGMTVVSPGDLWEAAEATKAITAKPGPAYLRIDKSAALPTQQPGEAFELGKCRRIREGSDFTIAVTGGLLGEVLAAAETLAAEGIECRVLSVHTVWPLDLQSITAACCETGGLAVAEEHSIHGGLAGAIAENLLEAGVAPRRFLRIGLRAGFSSIVGTQSYLRRMYGLDAAAIVKTIREAVQATADKSVYNLHHHVAQAAL